MRKWLERRVARWLARRGWYVVETYKPKGIDIPLAQIHITGARHITAADISDVRGGFVR